LKELFEYPNYGDMRSVRPSIRASEGALDALNEATGNWPKLFWQECLNSTACDQAGLDIGTVSVKVGTTIDQLHEVRHELIEHANKTSTTTAVDAKHAAVFGIAL